jgi:hypothetical protein
LEYTQLKFAFAVAALNVQAPINVQSYVSPGVNVNTPVPVLYVIFLLITGASNNISPAAAKACVAPSL